MILPKEIKCPDCLAILELDEEERKVNIIHCPECESAIDVRVEPYKILEKKEYTQILSSLNQGDLALIKSVLDTAKADYYILGENFLSVDPLIQPAKIYVLNDQVKKVKDLLKDFVPHIFGLSTSEEDDV